MYGTANPARAKAAEAALGEVQQEAEQRWLAADRRLNAAIVALIPTGITAVAGSMLASMITPTEQVALISVAAAFVPLLANFVAGNIFDRQRREAARDMDRAREYTNKAAQQAAEAQQQRAEPSAATEQADTVQQPVRVTQKNGGQR